MLPDLAKAKREENGMAEDGFGECSWYGCSETELTPDFVYVLSLKGSILYVSPSIKRVLGYDSGHLVDKNISALCHPVVIVPLIRELKSSAQAPADGPSTRHVNLNFPHQMQEIRVCLYRMYWSTTGRESKSGHSIWAGEIRVML